MWWCWGFLRYLSGQVLFLTIDNYCRQLPNGSTCSKTKYTIHHYAHEVIQWKKETSSQMKGMQRKSEERDWGWVCPRHITNTPPLFFFFFFLGSITHSSAQSLYTASESHKTKQALAEGKIYHNIFFISFCGWLTLKCCVSEIPSIGACPRWAWYRSKVCQTESVYCDECIQQKAFPCWPFDFFFFFWIKKANCATSHVHFLFLVAELRR